MIPRDHCLHHAVDVVNHGVVVDDVVDLKTSIKPKLLVCLTSWMDYTWTAAVGPIDALDGPADALDGLAVSC